MTVTIDVTCPMSIHNTQSMEQSQSLVYVILQFKGTIYLITEISVTIYDHKTFGRYSISMCKRRNVLGLF